MFCAGGRLNNRTQPSNEEVTAMSPTTRTAGMDAEWPASS